jgi:hypothetical protein
MLATRRLSEQPVWVNLRRRASWPAATGAPQRGAAVEGGHGFGLGPQERDRGPLLEVRELA